MALVRRKQPCGLWEYEPMEHGNAGSMVHYSEGCPITIHFNFGFSLFEPWYSSVSTLLFSSKCLRTGHTSTNSALSLSCVMAMFWGIIYLTENS